jgi:hypothetical protein
VIFRVAPQCVGRDTELHRQSAAARAVAAPGTDQQIIDPARSGLAQIVHWRRSPFGISSPHLKRAQRGRAARDADERGVEDGTCFQGPGKIR